LLIRTALQIIATAITNIVGPLIIGAFINVDGAILSDLSVYKKVGGIEGTVWAQGQTSRMVVTTSTTAGV